ncbi:exopolysaccharide biosynthesis protein [Xanthobacteraceae bacterium A53D]
MSDVPVDVSLAGARGAEADQQKLSDILRSIANDTTRERVSLADLLHIMQDRAVGALLFIFAVPNVLPTPPGTSSVLGAPLVFLSAQLMLGMRPWLPAFIAKRSIARKDFATLIGKAIPWLARAEALLRPRLGLMVHPVAERVVGLMCFILAVILILPIPLGNMLPALAISLMALGLLERDGVWTVLGLITAVLSIVVVWGVMFALVKSALYIIANAF